jgi:hypothetical protein
MDVRNSDGFRVTVDNRDYHYQSQTEIAGAKRIYQHLSELEHPSPLREAVSDFLRVGFCVANSAENLLMPIRKF